MMQHYRMVSWWLRKNYLPWPDESIKDLFRRRAENMAKAGVGSAIIFGAHFRWDFEPLWDQMNEMIRFIADELRQYGIILFDHHSSVLSCNYNTDRASVDPSMTLSNHRQVLISPPEGYMPSDSRDDWKMIDLLTGKPVLLPQYAAQQFCMNNPDFAAAYYAYVKRLVSETGINGLMSDDAFFNSYNGCGCRFCRERFKRDYCLDMPPMSATDFWGRWDNPEYRAYIKMHNDTTRDFLAGVKAVLPQNFPLMSCCCSSILPGTAERGLAYENFISSGANVVMLEMCGNTPRADGKLFDQLAAQMHHLAVARENDCPCIGLGYGFSTDAAAMIWAFNKFLGSDMWFSCLVHRLGLSDEDIKLIPDDPCLIGNVFNYEKTYSEWFAAGSSADIAILFSRDTLNNYGGSFCDYSADYIAACNMMVHNDCDADVVLEIPDPDSQYSVLVIPSAICVSDSALASIEKWIAAGKTVLISGPFAFYDEKGVRRKVDFASARNIDVSFNELCRSGYFPGQSPQPPAEPVRCISSAKQLAVAPACHWFPGRLADGTEAEFTALLKTNAGQAVNQEWAMKKYRDGDGRLIVHCLTSKYKIGLDEELERRRDPNSRAINHLKIISKVDALHSAAPLSLPVPEGTSKIEIMEPLSGKGPKHLVADKKDLVIDVAPDSVYFIVRFTF